MPDIFSREKRREIMSLIKGKETSIEKKVFRYLRSEGIYFQKHYKRVPGSPDVALPRKKKAIFIDGDFWHGYRFIKRQTKLPRGYWVEKIQNNIRRDRRVRHTLKKAGWSVLRIWEHELVRKRTEEQTLQKIKEFLLEDPR